MADNNRTIRYTGMTNELSSIVIKDTDNVATTLTELKAGQVVTVSIGDEVQKVALKNDIRFLHKFALEDIRQGQKIIKYGQVIGEATRSIRKGEHVHIQNVRSLRGRA